MTTSIGQIIIYTHKTIEMAAFYCKHFDFETVVEEGDRITELRATAGGPNILLHPAGQRQKQGQALVKLVFDVADVDAFCQSAAAEGLTFTKIHKANGYCFANAKDPTGNSVSVSSRRFRSAG